MRNYFLPGSVIKCFMCHSQNPYAPLITDLILDSNGCVTLNKTLNLAGPLCPHHIKQSLEMICVGPAASKVSQLQIKHK